MNAPFGLRSGGMVHSPRRWFGRSSNGHAKAPFPVDPADEAGIVPPPSGAGSLLAGGVPRGRRRLGLSSGTPVMTGRLWWPWRWP